MTTASPHIVAGLIAEAADDAVESSSPDTIEAKGRAMQWWANIPPEHRARAAIHRLQTIAGTTEVWF